ncbi:hypothetical protein [uncultured Winogradskyella sp.]|uniref:hypothetical protein n=1 Tax=uncultured Winogradskyella sp. TaxID=395353 RepID=UPI002630B23F|nr:hypothetical protein [uncultured Winogradskyella sp.]
MKFLKSFQYKTVLKSISIKSFVGIAFVAMVLVSCQSLKTAVFDQYSYQQAISLKVEGLNLMDEAVNDFTQHAAEVKTLRLDLQKIMEYEKNKPDNEVSCAMWKSIANEERNLLAGFLKRWKEKNQLSQVFIDEAKIQVSESIDLIIKYEGQKNKTNETKILNFLN